MLNVLLPRLQGQVKIELDGFARPADGPPGLVEDRPMMSSVALSRSPPFTKGICAPAAPDRLDKSAWASVPAAKAANWGRAT